MFNVYIIFMKFFLFVFCITYDCSQNESYFIETNMVAFFETTSFPTLLTLEEYDDCVLDFYTQKNESESINVFFALTYITGDNRYSSTSENEIYFLMYQNVFNISITDHLNAFNNVAFQGIVIFDEWINNCPMESISKTSPFFLEDETQIIYFQSSFHPNKARTVPCRWQFSAPSEFGFKVFILQFNVSSSTKLFISNTTDIIVNHRGVTTNRPYYNDDNYIQIYLTEGDSNYITEMEFMAYISPVKKKEKQINEDCIIYKVNNTILWYLWFLDDSKPKNGYKNNAYCNFTLEIPKSKAFYVSVEKLCLENDVDKIRYFFKENENYYIQEEFFSTIVGPYSDMTTTFVWWEFTSDGSLPSLGFYITFEEIDCYCENRTISCEITYNQLYTPMHYCNNYLCKFTIENCDTPLTRIVISNAVSIDITLLSNGLNIFEVKNFTMKGFGNIVAFIHSTSASILQAVSHVTIGVADFQLDVLPFDVPSINLNITISKSNPIYVLNIRNSNLTAVNVDSKSINSLIILYSSFEYGISLYTNTSLTKNIVSETCFQNPNINQCKINRNEFAILYHSDSEVDFSNWALPFLIIKLWGHSEGCVMKENVMFLKRGKGKLNIANIANNVECRIYVLGDHSAWYHISYLWTTATKENVKLLVGVEEIYTLLEFNSVTSKQWQTVPLFSPVYVIIIPPKAAIYFRLTETNFSPKFYLNAPFKSMLATPFFGTTTKNSMFLYKIFVRYEIGNYLTAKFTAIYYRMNGNICNESYFLVADNKKVCIEKSGDYFLFKNVTVAVVYDSARLTDGPNIGALFLIEFLNDTVEHQII